MSWIYKIVFIITILAIITTGCSNRTLESKISIQLKTGEYVVCNIPKIISHETHTDYLDYTGGHDDLYNEYLLQFNKDTLRIEISTQPRGEDCNVNTDTAHLNALAKMYETQIRAEERNADIFSVKTVNKNGFIFLMIFYNNGGVIRSCIKGSTFLMYIKNTSNKELINLIAESIIVTQQSIIRN